MKNEHQTQELARLFFLEWQKIHDHTEWDSAAKAHAFGRLLELLFIEVTKAENIQFTTMFARMSFACHRAQIEKRAQYWLHFFRRKIRNTPAPAPPRPPTGGESQRAAPPLLGGLGGAGAAWEAILTLGARTSADCICGLFGVEMPEEIAAEIPKTIPFQYVDVEVKAFHRQVRVVALEDRPDKERFLARDEANPSQLIEIQYNIAERNSSFNATVRQVRSAFGFPATLSLLDVEIDAEGVYRPRAIVVEPDHLMDVTAVANCFQGSNAEPVVYLLNKYLPFDSSVPLIVGNIANFFLDELMRNPQAIFKETFPKVFRTNPLTFSLLPDSTIREIAQTCQKHWVTLQSMVVSGMKKSGIEPGQCYLEPSFYDETHGLQGRLDIFLKNEEKSAIIELKSGSAFMPNRYGIGASHFVQTLLYDLMVRSIFGEGTEPANYILYSKLDSNQLRYAPPVKSQQYEALQVRNQLVAVERHLAGIQKKLDVAPLLQRISTSRFPHLKGYLSKNIQRFEKAYSQLDEVERRYFNAFSGFIAREHQLAKTGIQGVDQANGLAALWLDNFAEKQANFRVLKCLKIKENRGMEENPIIVFERSPETDPLANFRVGDIGVLYPVRQSESSAVRQFDSSTVTSHQSPITSQIFKITITELTPESVTVRLRYSQFNLEIFEENELWNLEPDMMDMGYNGQYKGLFQWAEQVKGKRDLLLTRRAPAPAPPAPQEGGAARWNSPPLGGLGGLLGGAGGGWGLTDEQKTILQKMLSAKEYFLLWGPPGTGKTSMMLKNYARWIFENTDENLLLLAYTNRAVDEICEALESIGEEVKKKYIRIGSRYSTAERFENQLLTSKIAKVAKRSELKGILAEHRIFVSTLASLSNNQQLLKLKKFRRVVIDEASQILEPALVGLLPKFEQFILIGDHKQLPAVVVQPPEKSVVSDELLHEIGLKNLRNSFFERLYMRCVAEGWDWAFDHLSQQGRMHTDIMRFPCDYFYEGKLKILPDGLLPKQVAPLPGSFAPKGQASSQNELSEQIENQRLSFISTKIDAETPSRKTNRFEAEKIVELALYFRGQTNHQSPITNHQSIGIITPYRAQIALIKEVLQKAEIDTSDITIDTVERYQGGARDIILISLCTNAASQMDSLVSLSEEGVDRKLNVALTRARERVVVLGNEELLSQNSVYRAFIDFCR